MSLNAPDQIRRRFSNSRPGLELLGLVEAALPVTTLRIDVLAQERKPLPLLDEFILQFVREGVQDPDELTAILGLDREQVLNVAADQISEGNLRRTEAGLGLTAQGLEVARDLAAITPVIRQLPVPFDRVTWTIENYAQISLIRKKDAEERGYLMLPAKKKSRIAPTDVTVERFGEITRERDDRNRLVEILQIRKIAAQNQHRYLPVQLLVWGSVDNGEVELGVCIDGELRPEHGLELAANDVVKKLNIQVGEPQQRPILDPELERLRVPAEEVEVLTNSPETADSPAAPAEDRPRNIDEIQVRSVSVFEHPEHLEKALTGAKKRLLIISPWIKGGVVNADFVGKLERRIRAGVEVYIGYGIGTDDYDCDEWALRKLQNLAKRFEDKPFHFVRLQNTHAKILIYDGIWINTSFNWMSFKGDPDRTFRMEEGTLVQIPSEVDKAYTQYVDVLHQDARPDGM